MEKLSFDKFKNFEKARLINTKSIMGGKTTTSSTPPDGGCGCSSGDTRVEQDPDKD